MKKILSAMLSGLLFLSTGCSKDKLPPTIELLQKEAIVKDSNYDPTENILSVKDDVDGKLEYDKGNGEVKGKYTIERRNINDYGYTAVVNATDNAGNTSTAKFSVEYDDFINDVTKNQDENSPKEISNESDEPSETIESTEQGIQQSGTVSVQPVTPEQPSSQPAPVEEKKKQLDTPGGITASTDAKGWTIQWVAVDQADYYEISLDGSLPQRANTNYYIYDSSQIISVGNHTLTIKAFSVNSTYTESEEGSGLVQYEPLLKTIPVMYILGENQFVECGNPIVEVYVGMDYTYQELDSMAGGFAAAAQKTLKNPTGTVHIYDSTTFIQIYLNEQES